MAISPIADRGETERTHTFGFTRLLVTGGMTFGAIFVLCWVGTFFPFSSPTHAYIGLFTDADTSSIEALLEGTAWALLFGAIAGAVFASAYNLTAPLARR